VGFYKITKQGTDTQPEHSPAGSVVVKHDMPVHTFKISPILSEKKWLKMAILKFSKSTSTDPYGKSAWRMAEMDRQRVGEKKCECECEDE